MMVRTITAEDVRSHWINRQELALLDVREEGPYADAHAFFALSVPVSEIEAKLPSLVPRLSAPIVVYDNGEGYVSRAASRILAMGYVDVSILDGGLKEYARVGELFRDVNVPSKAFGELVEAITHTPSLPASEIEGILRSDTDVIVLDARRFHEYNTMSIPRAQSCPGGELVYRLFEVAPSPDTTVIVNCAGRTRSIVGTQSLIDCGVPNKVLALRDGTIGWVLEGLELEHGKEAVAPHPSAEALRKAKHHADAWTKHVGVPVLDSHKFTQLLESSLDTRSVYLLDVRDPDEYNTSHPDGFVSAPGGQLVQATDEWVGVRGGCIVLYDTDGIRARMTGSWLLQMGWDVYVLDGGVLGHYPSLPKSPMWYPHADGTITVKDLVQLENATVLDLARSPMYRRGHIPGAWFASGPEVLRDARALPDDGPIVLTSPDGRIAAMNVEYLRKSLKKDVFYLRGGTAAWSSAGHAIETLGRWLSDPIDVYQRPYEGTDNPKQAMQDYIDWEHQLIAQLANDGVAGFRVKRKET